MKKNVVKVILTVMLGIIFSGGVMIIEESNSSNSFANDDNNRHIQPMDRLNVEPDLPPPPPPPPGGGLTN